MKSIKHLYKIGRGPSSSHTIGPQTVCEYLLKEYGKNKYRIDLYNSLSLTGKGHGTDKVIREILGEETEINFINQTDESLHPNTFDVYAFVGTAYKKILRAESIGGGSVVVNGKDITCSENIYPEHNFSEVKTFCHNHSYTLADYVRHYEPDIDCYMLLIWQTMKESVERGLNKEGVLSGGLNLSRKAKKLYYAKAKYETTVMSENRKLSAYSFAVAEENADNGIIVTAPTCGSAGILPACLYYMYKNYNVDEKEIVDALLCAGVIGNVVKQNASVSGAECGCQAEIGVACSMASAAIANIYECSLEKIECAAEIALEHNLGLTCDPVMGLVQIPCIERNATASVKAFNAVTLANSLSDEGKVSFDSIVQVMYETGKDMASNYRETSQGGLAKMYKQIDA